MNDRFDRQLLFFGQKGQKLLQNKTVAVVGVGGIGSHIAQQLAFLGVGNIILIDDDLLNNTNLNRLIGARHTDPLGMPKVLIAERNIKEIDTSINVIKVQDNLVSTSAFEALRESEFVFGGMDNDGARLVLNEYCIAYDIPYLDAASDIFTENVEYGGRVIFVIKGNPCLYCLGEISAEQARIDLETTEARKDREAIYGVKKDDLGQTGPSVVTINGIIASLATTEFMLHVTEIRIAKPLLTYRGTRGIVNSMTNALDENCYYCNLRGHPERAGLYGYIRNSS